MTKSDHDIYRRFVEMVSSDYIFYSHDIDGTMTYISPHIKEVLGISAEQIIGQKWQEIFSLPDESINKGTLADIESADGKAPSPYEFEVTDHNQNPLTFELQECPSFNEKNEVIGVDGIARNITERKREALEREELIHDLKKSLEEIRTLKGIIPICSYCKNIRNDEGAWDRLEKYICEHSDAEFSHGICPECIRKHKLDKI
jgi:PAS domain S-box-containing protein